MITIGNVEISAVCLGNIPADGVYFGTELIWQPKPDDDHEIQ